VETRAQYSREGTLTASTTDPIIGIDLGTTNSALAWSNRRGPIHTYEVPQLVASGEISRVSTLPSFLYFTDAAERDNGSARLPWDPSPSVVAGLFAREEGTLIPSRQISSAKSWLSNVRVDRTAALLPWGAESGPKLSAVDASTRLLAHLRDAWNHDHPSPDNALRLERRPIVLTVPASFDEEGRELTVQAARDAGFEQLVLLEEPLAALYAWIARHRRELSSVFGQGALILVCDVGGGTTDFSLIRAGIEEGDVAFERIAIGEHLLLGGDNLDLALAMLVEQKLRDPGRLSLTQRQILRRKCSAAKEHLLSDSNSESVTITILGSGRGVIGGGMSANLTRTEVVDAILNGFLPVTAADELPARDRRMGLRELGLPYETEPAITKHLAAFLSRAARTTGTPSLARPDAVLFNGGFFVPALARDRVLDALARWLGDRPRVLENERPESAVAIGAAFYGRLRHVPSQSRRLLIRAGSARAYYVGVQSPGSAPSTTAAEAICILPRGTEEGSRFELDREFTIFTNQPAAFTLYSSPVRTDALNALVTLKDEDDVTRHAPLVTALRFGKRSRRVPLAVRLAVSFTETGTLELWCESRTTDHRWRLAFNLRGIEADPLDADEPGEVVAAAAAQVVVADDALERATELIRQTFDPAATGPQPDSLVGELENALGHGKHAWPVVPSRQLADVLIEVERGRRKSAAHEARWLNLTGFCARPGFGSSLDVWRVSELRKVYAAGLAFPREIQNQVEWVVLWQRVAAGFTAGQQRELAQRIAGQLGLGQRKPARVNPQIERESWRLLASLERLESAYRTRIGDGIIELVRRDPRNVSWLWAIGRVGARIPLYGPLNSCVSATVAERWLERLLALKEITPDAATAISLIGARTDDPARDLGARLLQTAAVRLEDSGFPDTARTLQDPSSGHRPDAGQVFGESLPKGLQLAVKDA
jgi:molecular chaperone DnaK (HSP70)